MRIPHSISKNVLAAYRCSPETLSLPREEGRTLRPEDASWDDDAIPDLKTLALRVIISIWKDYPILKALPTCVDKDMLLEMLPTDLPFELTIRKIEDGIYWERAAKDRWEYNNPSEHGDSWRQLYCERHLAEYLETLEPNYFEEEDCEEVIILVKDYIHVLKLCSLVSIKPSKEMEDEENEMIISKKEDIVHHIPMAVILPQLLHLTEFYMNFGMIYMDDGFEWRDFEFSMEDCISLSKGIKKSPKLRKFSLTRSNLDRPRVAIILHGMKLNNNIEELDLSYCKLADTGAHAIGAFLSMHRNLRTLRLVNNNIGPSGIAGIIHGILIAESSALRDLDIRLNPLEEEGANYVCALLLRNKILKTLNISSCGLTAEAGTTISEVLSSGCVELESLSLDISNNNFGPIVGELFDAVVQSWTYITHLDGRMCNFSKESEHSINKHAYRNKQNIKKKRNETGFYHRRTISTDAKDLQELSEVEISSPQGSDISFTKRSDSAKREMMKSVLKALKPINRVHWEAQ